MTLSPDVAPARFASAAEAITALRARGLRASTARRLVLEALFAAAAPISAPELARSLALDESSVYRNLELLEGHGMVHHVHLGHGPGLYRLAGSDEEYLYCQRCGGVTALAPSQLDDARQLVSRRFGFAARFDHFAMIGLCGGCADPLPDVREEAWR